MTNLFASMLYAGLVSVPRLGTHYSVHAYVQAGGPFGAKQ